VDYFRFLSELHNIFKWVTLDFKRSGYFTYRRV